MPSVQSTSLRVTKGLAQLFAHELLKTKPRKKGAFIIGLQGELGSGKTTFIQAFARALGIRANLPSPTFIIMRNYPVPKKNRVLYHIDAYRIQPKDLKTLIFKDIARDPNNIIAIEWADVLKKILPKNIVWVEFAHGKKENERIISWHA